MWMISVNGSYCIVIDSKRDNKGRIAIVLMFRHKDCFPEKMITFSNDSAGSTCSNICRWLAGWRYEIEACWSSWFLCRIAIKHRTSPIVLDHPTWKTTLPIFKHSNRCENQPRQFEFFSSPSTRGIKSETTKVHANAISQDFPQVFPSNIHLFGELLAYHLYPHGFCHLEENAMPSCCKILWSNLIFSWNIIQTKCFQQKLIFLLHVKIHVFTR